MTALVDDVAIVGGGPAGALAAVLLARQGLRVRVFDRARFPRPKLCGDTLNPGAVQLLARHLDVSPVRAAGLPLSGMRVSGPGGVVVEGRYPDGVEGVSISRATLDAWLLDEARRAGAAIEENAPVVRAVTSEGRVTGLVVRTSTGERRHSARMVVAADGRASTLARAWHLSRTPRHPRRWAFGVYAHGVTGLDKSLGEMHVRRAGYLGIAPVIGGVSNVCLVVDRALATEAIADPWKAIQMFARHDDVLAGRLESATPIGRPVVLGPMAVEGRRAGVPGLLLAGDAAGFIDPMTGDGLRLAFDGAVAAAHVAADTVCGRTPPADAPARLAAVRRRRFTAKWRFNRGLRALVATPVAVSVAARAGQRWPGAIAAVVRYAGDVDWSAAP